MATIIQFDNFWHWKNKKSLHRSVIMYVGIAALLLTFGLSIVVLSRRMQSVNFSPELVSFIINFIFIALAYYTLPDYISLIEN